VVIYLLPIWPLWNMQTTLRRRLGLIAIFTLGGGTILVSTLRFIVLWQLSNTDDVSYIFGSVTIVTSIEFAVAILTANMPAMAAFYRSKISKTAQISTGHYGYGSSPGMSREHPKGTIGSSQKRDKLSGHTEEGFIRTDSQEELYPMSRLSRKGDKNDISRRQGR
jgi:hypothetical protein